MEIVILGSGSAYGTPMLGGYTHGADISNPKNIRFRSSILVKAKQGSILIDISPDIREQSLRYKIKDIDAVLLTHGHSDHMAGLWELPRYAYNADKNINLYTSETTMSFVKQMFSFMFNQNSSDKSANDRLSWNIIEEKKTFNCLGLDITPLFFPHEGINKKVVTTGYLINEKILYSTDLSGIKEDNAKHLYNLDSWIIDCNNGTNPRENGHLSLNNIIELQQRFKPARMYLTHIQDNIDFDEFSAILPDGIELLYDGQILDL